MSSAAARIQLRVAVHIGPVHHDGHGFVGDDVNLLFRMLDARSLKQMLADSGAEVGVIVSRYVYENVIRRRPNLIDPAAFKPLNVRVKLTRIRAWAYLPGPPCRHGQSLTSGIDLRAADKLPEFLAAVNCELDGASWQVDTSNN